MNTRGMIFFLRHMEAHGKAIFEVSDLAVWFKASLNTIQQAIKRHIACGLIIRAARGLYISGINSSVLGKSPLVFVPYLRPGEFSYESYESRLSDLGLISQIPSVTTVATTGKPGKNHTILGDIEFTHISGEMTRRFAQTEFSYSLKTPLANEELALYDLHYAGRSIGLVEENAWKEYTWNEYAGL